MRTKRRNTGPTQETRQAVMERDQFKCVRCGRAVSGEPGRDFSLQHRIPRGMGGSRDPRLNLPSNLVLMCGSGATMCHGHVESYRADAETDGYLVPRHLDPAEVPVTVATWPASGRTPAVTVQYLLDDLGGRTAVDHVDA